MFGTALPNRVLFDRTLVKMCCHCRRIRTVDGWQAEEVPAGLRVTHGICRNCYATHYPEFGPPPEE